MQWRGSDVKHINELEYIPCNNEISRNSCRGYVLANLWYQDLILVIDHMNGEIMRVIDLRSLYPMKIRPPNADCMNGIAFNSSSKTVIVTGKYWPLYFDLPVTAFEEPHS